MKPESPAIVGASNLLVVKLSSLGDVVRATGPLRRLREAVPGARIWMAVDPRFSGVLDGHPDLDVRLVPSPGARFWVGHFLAARRALREAGAPRFDAAIDLQGTARSGAWMLAARARIRGGRGGWRPGWDFARPARLDRNDVADQAALLGPLGLDPTPLAPRLCPVPEADARVAARLVGAGLPGRGFVAINPFSSWESKAWPWDRYAAIAAWCEREHGLRCVISGGPGEERRMPSNSGPGWVSWVGQSTLAETVCLLARARLAVTGDSGPMHIAAAVGTPVLALFGPTHPERSGPWGPGHRVIQTLRPGIHHAYREPGARSMMLAIDVETVRQAADEMLRSPPREGSR